MGLRITGTGQVENNIAKAQREAASSLERLSSGVRFTRSEPLPADRAVSDSLTSKLRELNSYKRNANDGISLVQTAESALGEMSNITIRLKELATNASSAALSDKERAFLFVEYESLYEELSRLAQTTEFGGVALLNGEGRKGSEGAGISFRIGRPPSRSGDKDTGLVTIDALKDVVASPENLEVGS